MFSQASKNAHWRHAMAEECNALLKNGTWILIPLNTAKNVVSCKWNFRIKQNPDGTISYYKVRLVAKGYHQQLGLDYKDTFSPVLKPATLRLVLSISISKGWDVQHLDVSNAFLHGSLTEEIYMQQPSGFMYPSKPYHLCLLKKSLYGLKQAPREWFSCVCIALLNFGFNESHTDPSLFIYNSGGMQGFFMVYVDDIIHTGSTSTFMTLVIQYLQQQFAIKTLSRLHYFLGLEAHWDSHGLLSVKENISLIY